MTLTPIHSLVLHAIQEVTADRLHKAVCGLADGSLTITLTRQSDADIRALVKNGTGAEYGVTLTAALTTCSCKDSLYRGGICKHAVGVALYVLRTPTPPPATPVPTLHLMWREGMVLCGEPHPMWAALCPSCMAASHPLAGSPSTV